MQYNSDKQDYNRQDNNSSSECIYPSYQGTPPPYSPYSEQSVGETGYVASGKTSVNQPSLHRQKGIIIKPVYQSTWNNKLVTSLTTRLQIFLGLSGFIYSLWGITAISLEIAIVINSYSTYYNGFWTGGFLIVGGIIMMIAAFRTSYTLAHLIRIYTINLSFCTIGFIFSIVNYAISNRCISMTTWYCDGALESTLKIILMIIFNLALIHTIINMVFISKEQRKTLLKSNSYMPIY